MRMARRLLGFWDRKRSVPGIVGELVVSEIWDIFWYRVGAVFRRRRVLILKGSRITWDELRFRVCRNAYFWINTNFFSPFRKGPPRVRGSWVPNKVGHSCPLSSPASGHHILESTCAGGFRVQSGNSLFPKGQFHSDLGFAANIALPSHGPYLLRRWACWCFIAIVIPIPIATATAAFHFDIPKLPQPRDNSNPPPPHPTRRTTTTPPWSG